MRCLPDHSDCDCYEKKQTSPSEPTVSLTYEDVLKDILVNLALDTKSKGYVADADVYEALKSLQQIEQREIAQAEQVAEKIAYDIGYKTAVNDLTMGINGSQVDKP